MKRLAYVISRIFFVIIFLTGCSSNLAPVDNSQSKSTQGQIELPVGDSGHLYLRLGNVEGQFYHHFVRVPAACLVDQAACAEVEPV
ncbi:MAG: hypothetical protein SVR94_17260, partial [Pseudomonadota bacterium]|nr:hypothetical protein [Pseudomonadota bacterium]